MTAIYINLEALSGCCTPITITAPPMQPEDCGTFQVNAQCLIINNDLITINNDD